MFTSILPPTPIAAEGRSFGSNATDCSANEETEESDRNAGGVVETPAVDAGVDVAGTGIAGTGGRGVIATGGTAPGGFAPT